MSQHDYDNKQSDPHDDQLFDMQKLSDLMRQVKRGQEAQMSILRYLLKRDGSLRDEGTPSTGEEGSRSRSPGKTVKADILVGLVLDGHPLPDQSSSALEPPSSKQNLDLSTREKFTALRAQMAAGAGRYTSIKTSPILPTREPKSPLEVRKSKSFPWEQKQIPVEEDHKRDMDLPDQNVELGGRSVAGYQKRVKKAESRFGEASVFTTSSSGNISGSSVYTSIPNNGMAWMTDESSRGSTPPGHIKPITEKLKKLNWDGKQGPLCGLLNVGRRLSHDRDDNKNDIIRVVL